jgi:hypothetical protein
MKSLKSLTTLTLMAALSLFLVVSVSQAQGTSDANQKILMQKIKADKKLLVASNMDLTDAESKVFWPQYDGYQKELDQINDHLVSVIKEYADAFNKGPIPNDKSTKLMHDFLATEEAEVDLKSAYAKKIAAVMSPAKAARYIQIENKIRALLKAEMAQQIPLIY